MVTTAAIGQAGPAGRHGHSQPGAFHQHIAQSTMGDNQEDIQVISSPHTEERRLPDLPPTTPQGQALPRHQQEKCKCGLGFCRANQVVRSKNIPRSTLSSHCRVSISVVTSSTWSYLVSPWCSYVSSYTSLSVNLPYIYR